MPDETARERLLDAGALLAAGGVFGMVWIDRSLCVEHSYGRLAEFVALGRPVSESIIALVGLEESLDQLAAGAVPFVDLPAVAMRESAAPETRLNLTFCWMERWQQHLLLLSRAIPQSNLEHQLTQQMRARLMAEADARAMAQGLAIANRDLEEFASIISHDLRAPMRALRYLAADAEVMARTGPSESLTATLRQVSGEAQRLSSMLGALFDYSSAGRKTSLVERVDLRTLTQQIVARLPRASRFLVRIEGDWPELDTVAAPFEQVLTNLADNAMKYHDEPVGTLVIEAAETRHHLLVTVTDDGPGIPQACRDVVFLPFRRLDERSPVEGSGMGLALVKRSVERIGGRIDLASPVKNGRGTQFRVHWPKVIASGSLPGLPLG